MRARPLPIRAGVGLKTEHMAEILTKAPSIGFFEIHAENYLIAGGPLLHQLTRIRERYPLSIHGVGLSIGGEAPLDAEHLERLARLLDRYEPAVFSEHLAWSSRGGHYFGDLLPLRYTAAALQRVCAHIDQVQNRLKRRILLENPATYVEYRGWTLSETDFLCEVVHRSGCGLLLDINNVYVSCINHRRDPLPYLRALPIEATEEIHLAGHAEDQDDAGFPLLIDDHGSPVCEQVWALFRYALRLTGPVPTLIERDHDVPPLDVLLAEAARAEQSLLRAPFWQAQAG